MNGPLDMIHTFTQGPTADDLARREYAKAAPHRPADWWLDKWISQHSVSGPQDVPESASVEWAWDWADAMLAEQKRREAR